MKTLIFLRHGKTKYTGVFPDLSDEGKEEIGKAANEIAEFIKQRETEDIVLKSSPAPRALGSADIIARKLGHPREVEQELGIRCMDFYDAEAANAIWATFASARDVDRAYTTDHRFEDGKVIEKRSIIQDRFYMYLGTLFERFAAGTLPDITIHTSHYEVLWHLAATFGFQEPLIHGEVIRLQLTSALENEILVGSVFRDYKRQFICRPPLAVFRSQF